MENLKDFESRVIKAFASVADQHGKRNMAGMTVDELAEGSIFAVRHLRLGKTAEKLSALSVDGQTVDLDEHRGKVVLLDFWATWCAPCVATLPELKKLRNEIDESKLAIIGVSGDTEKARLSKFINDHDVQWPNIFDRSGVVQKRWQALSLPSYYVLDEHAVVRYRGGDKNAAIAVVKSLLGVAPNGNLPFAEIAKSISETLDVNKDQRIEPSEMPDEMKAELVRADLDKDGSLSLTEITDVLKNATTTEAVPANAPSPQGDGTK